MIIQKRFARDVAGALAALMALSTPASSASSTLRIGDATIEYDAARWQAVAKENDAALFVPRGEAAQKLDAVEFGVHPDTEAASCADISARLFSAGHYDASHVRTIPTTIGGVAAERYEAHTRCRNATPTGTIACIRRDRRTYVLLSLQTGCGGSNLFSGVDPLGEIAKGVRFEK